jgi:glucose-6-phosphate 1-epimerase
MVLFVQFGPGPMQQHGFARNVPWEVASTSADLQPDERDPSIEFVLGPSEYSKKMFPFKFKVVYTVTLHGQQLQTQYRCDAPCLTFRGIPAK